MIRNQLRRAPQASAASCCASSNGVGWGPTSIPSISAGRSSASACSPIASASRGAAPGQSESRRSRLYLPALIEGNRRRPSPDSLRARTKARRRGRGAPQLVPDQRRLAGKPRRLRDASPLRIARRRAAKTSTPRPSTACDRRAEPAFVAPELDPELDLAHCVTPQALDEALAATPDVVGAITVSPTYFGAVADVTGSPRSLTPVGCRSSSTRPGGRTCTSPTCSPRRRSRPAPTS